MVERGTLSLSSSVFLPVPRSGQVYIEWLWKYCLLFFYLRDELIFDTRRYGKIICGINE
jgi:hypothetical protein